MLLRWYRVLFLGSLLMNLSYGQDGDDEPEARVILTIDTRPKSSFDARSSEEVFTCYECIHCQEKSNQTIRICQPDVNMCFTTYKQIDNINRIVRRGCSASKEHCTVPMDDVDNQLQQQQRNSFESVTCCMSPKCNQGIRVRLLVILLIFELLLMVIFI